MAVETRDFSKEQIATDHTLAENLNSAGTVTPLIWMNANPMMTARTSSIEKTFKAIAAKQGTVSEQGDEIEIPT